MERVVAISHHGCSSSMLSLSYYCSEVVPSLFCLGLSLFPQIQLTLIFFTLIILTSKSIFSDRSCLILCQYDWLVFVVILFGVLIVLSVSVSVSLTYFWFYLFVSTFDCSLTVWRLFRWSLALLCISYVVKYIRVFLFGIEGETLLNLLLFLVFFVWIFESSLLNLRWLKKL